MSKPVPTRKRNTECSVFLSNYKSNQLMSYRPLTRYIKVRQRVPQFYITFSMNLLLIYYYFDKLIAKNWDIIPGI